MKIPEHVALTVIRTVGERTLACTAAALAEECENVRLLQIAPFARALQRCFEMGAASRSKWLLVCDADVIPHPGAVASLIAAADDMDSDFWTLQGMVVDKLYGNVRAGGMRLYRRVVLHEALRRIPKVLREWHPERVTVSRMFEDGFPADRSGIVTGIHDFEQSYEDLWRKGCAHGLQFERTARQWLPRWYARAREDIDLRAACLGVLGAERMGPYFGADVRKFYDLARVPLADAGLRAKPALVKRPNVVEIVEAALAGQQPA